MSDTEPSRRTRPTQSYARIAKVGALWTLAQQTGSQAMLFAGGIVLARLLTPYDFGIAAAVGFFLRLANKLSTIGFGASLIRLKEVRPEHLSSVFVASLTLSVTMWLALLVSAPWLARVFRDDAIAPALRVAATIYLLLPFGVGQMAQMHRRFNFKPLGIIEWTNSFIFVLVSVGLAVAGYGYWSLIWAALFGNGAATILKLYLGGVQPQFRFSKTAFLEVVPFGVGLQAKRILTFGAEYVDSLIVGRLLGLPALGLYDKAFSTVDRVVDRLSAGRTVVFRIFSIIRDEPERLRRAYKKATLGATLLGLPGLTALVVLAPELIPFLYGDQWRFSIAPFQILCVAGAFRIMVAYASAAVQAQGHIWAEIWRLGFYFILVVVGAAVGAKWGITGVAVGITSANGVMFALMQTLVCKLTDLRWRDVFGVQAPAIGICVFVAVMMLTVDGLLRVGHPGAADWQHLALKVIAAAVSTLLVFLRPPSSGVRDVRDELVTELIPWAGRFFPAWAGVPTAASSKTYSVTTIEDGSNI